MARPKTIEDEELLRRVAEAVLEQGASISTKSLAEGVGLSEGALFKRFGTKREMILEALVPPAIPTLFGLLEAGPDPDRSIPEQLVEIGEAVLNFFSVMLPRDLVLRTMGLTLPEIFERYDEPPPVLAVRGLASWLEKAQDQGLVRSGSMHGVSRAIFGSMHMECFTSHLQAGTVDREQALGMLRSVIDSLWPGLRPDAQESN